MSKASDKLLALATGSSSDPKPGTRKEAELPRTGLIATTSGTLIDPTTQKVVMEAPLDVTD